MNIYDFNSIREEVSLRGAAIKQTMYLEDWSRPWPNRELSRQRWLAEQKELCLLALETEPMLLAKFPPYLRDDERIVVKAITLDVEVLKYASDRLRIHPRIVALYHSMLDAEPKRIVRKGAYRYV